MAYKQKRPSWCCSTCNRRTSHRIVKCIHCGGDRFQPLIDRLRAAWKIRIRAVRGKGRR